MFLSISFIGIFRLQQKIAQHRYWPLEIIRTSVPTSTKGKGKEEDYTASFHGIAYVDLAPLIYPGVNKIRGAYQINPYIESTVQEKLQRKGVMSDDVVRTVIGSIRSNSSLGHQKPGTRMAKADQKANKVR